MENLFCNEVWLMSPNARGNDGYKVENRTMESYFYSTDEDYEEAFGILLEKEARYMPEQGYLMLVQSNDLIHKARVKAVKWFIKCQGRMNLCFGTIFNAVNYLDRFISLTQCPGWKYWMFELLSVACFSVASKFNETTTIPLHEFQVEGMDHLYAPSLIQRMELTLLKALGWRMDCTTSFSYVELLLRSIIIDFQTNPSLEDLTSRSTDLLLNILSDSEFLEFQPCVVAISAIRCVCEDMFPPINNYNNDFLTKLISIIPRDQKDDLFKCQMMVGKILSQDHDNLLNCGNYSSNYSPSSPVTVLKVECCNFYDDLWGVLKMPDGIINTHLRPNPKRKRAEREYGL